MARREQIKMKRVKTRVNNQYERGRERNRTSRKEETLHRLTRG